MGSGWDFRVIVILEHPSLETTQSSAFIFRISKQGVYLYTEGAIRTFYTVPVGFLTDGESAPRGAWNLFPPFDPQTLDASVLHDWLYATHEAGSRAAADLMFSETLAISECPAWKRTILYEAVHWFGQGSYDSGPERLKRRAAFVHSASQPCPG